MGCSAQGGLKLRPVRCRLLLWLRAGVPVPEGTGPRFSTAVAIRLSRQTKPELVACSVLRVRRRSCGSGLFCQLCSRGRRSRQKSRTDSWGGNL